MPLAKYLEIEPGTTLGVWKITETIDELKSHLFLNKEEFDAVALFKSENRRKQWLSYRVLIRLLLNIDTIYRIEYTANGKPYLTNPLRNISVSHSGDISATIISDNPLTQPGIDVELINSKIMMLKSRFLSPIESINASICACPLTYTLYWSAKEAVYKSLNRDDISIRENIFIEKFINSQGKWEINVKAFIDNKVIFYKVLSQLIDDYIISFTLGPDNLTVV